MTKSTESERLYFTPPEIAKELGVSKNSILLFIASGELKASNIGRKAVPRWRVTRPDFVEFMNKRSNRKNRVEGTPFNKVANYQPCRSSNFIG